jgi:hypothetical protein
MLMDVQQQRLRAVIFENKSEVTLLVCFRFGIAANYGNTQLPRNLMFSDWITIQEHVGWFIDKIFCVDFVE